VVKEQQKKYTPKATEDVIRICVEKGISSTVLSLKKLGTMIAENIFLFLYIL